MAEYNDDDLLNSSRNYFNRLLNDDYEDDYQCNEVNVDIPPALKKALFDPFCYRLQLTTGEVIHFEEADLVGTDWVHLSVSDSDHKENRFVYCRGVDVRISQIVWVQDDGQ